MANFVQTPIKRRSFIKGGAAAGALVALAGCGKTSDTAKGSGGTLNVYNGNPKYLDPYNLQESEGTSITSNIFDGLVKYDYREKKLVPAVAASWEASNDNKTFTFHLREGVKFHNGEDCDAQSFKRGWERIVNPKTQGSPSVISYHLALVQGYDDMLNGKTEDLAGLTCPDNKTFVINLSASFGDFPTVCAHPALVPVPKAALDNPADFAKAPIGNGPFQMDGKWVDDQYVNLKRFDNYYGEKAKLDAVHFAIQKDPQTGFKEFQAGNIDLCPIPSTQFKATKEQYGEAEENGYLITPKHQVADGPNVTTSYLLVNLADPVMKDVDVRRALSLAINRQAIVDSVLQGDAAPADNIIPPTIEGYTEGAWADCTYDQAKANALLDKKYPRQADGSRGLSIKLEYNLGGNWKDIMEAVANDWSQVGVKVEMITKQWSAVIDDYQAKKFQIGRFGWSADYPIADNFLYPLFASSSSDNNSGFNDSSVDKGIAEARATTDDKQRVAKYQEVNKQIAEQMPVIPILFGHLGRVGSDKIKKQYCSPDTVEFVQTEMK